MIYLAPSDNFKNRVSTAWGLAQVNKTTVPVLRALRDAIDAMLIKQDAANASALPRPHQGAENEA